MRRFFRLGLDSKSMPLLFGFSAFLVLLFAVGMSFMAQDSATAAMLIAVERSNDGLRDIFKLSLGGKDSGSSASWSVDGRQMGDKPLLWTAFSEAGSHFIEARVGNRKCQTRLRADASPDRGPEPLWLTLNSPDSPFTTEGNIAELRGPGDDEAKFIELGSGPVRVLRAALPGYYSFTVSTGNGPRKRFLFVSPIPSVQLDRIDRNWYYTQFNTLTTSNCGPTVASIALAWSRGIDVGVAEIRARLGWRGTGAVSLQELKGIMDDYGVSAEISKVASLGDIMALLETGRGVGVSYNMAGLPEVEDPADNLFGQYYTDHGGHYLFLKGFSLDRKWFVIYDPIPSDWRENRERYSDGVSMFGRNRYYPAAKLYEALLTHEVLAVSRDHAD